MAIEFNTLFNNIDYAIYSIPIVSNIFSSILYTSIVLSIIVIIIVLFIYPFKNDTSIWVLSKLFIYLSVANLVIFSSQHSIISNKYKLQNTNAESKQFINSINQKGGRVYSDEDIKVVPKIKEPDYDVQSEFIEYEEEVKPKPSDTVESILNIDVQS